MLVLSQGLKRICTLPSVLSDPVPAMRRSLGPHVAKLGHPTEAILDIWHPGDLPDASRHVRTNKWFLF